MSTAACAPSRPRLTFRVIAFPLLVMTCAASSPPEAAFATRDFADPFVLRQGGTYYAYGTGAEGRHLQVARSTDLTSWSMLPDALPVLPSWASPAPGLTWAPSVLRRGTGFGLYYTARHAASELQCVSRAVSARPEGPYVDGSAQPFVCQISGDSSLCGSIDPSPFVDESGDAFLYWKSDENSARCRGDSRIWGQRLSADGLEVVGAAVPLLTTDRSWERPLIEGPAMIVNERAYHLFYSANWYESASYAIGYASCASPLGPCTKVTTGAPLVKSAGDRFGPGGQEFFDDPAGARWMAYHAWSSPSATYTSGGARTLRIARLTFANGAPVLTERDGSPPAAR